jgi:hypothetical protein
MAYINHMLHRLDNIGRELPILKELGRLPGNSTCLYELLFQDCSRNRSDKEIIQLRKFLAWVAYAKWPMSLPLAQKVVTDNMGNSNINLDEELEYRSARYVHPM